MTSGIQSDVIHDAKEHNFLRRTYVALLGHDDNGLYPVLHSAVTLAAKNSALFRTFEESVAEIMPFY